MNCNIEMFRKKKAESERENWKFCSRSCSTIYNNKNRNKDISGYKNCLNCGNDFPYRDTLLVRSAYSKKYECMIGSVAQKYCSKKCSISDMNKNNNPAQTTEGRNKISLSAKAKGTAHMMTEEARDKQRNAITGEKHWNWKGGITPTDKIQRNSLEYKLWRTSVFERDDYTCQLCHKRGGNLNADHIKRFCDHPELRFDINNGRTLCVECHRKTDTYGGHR